MVVLVLLRLAVSLSIMSSGVVHSVAGVRKSFLLRAESYSAVWVEQRWLSIPASADAWAPTPGPCERCLLESSLSVLLAVHPDAGLLGCTMILCSLFDGA